MSGTAGTGTAGAPTAKIENYGNGWFRVSVAFTTGSAAATTNALFQPIQTSTAVSRSCYMYGAQFEARNFLTTYMPSTGSPGVRIIENLTVSGLTDKNIIGPSGGSWFFELKNNGLFQRLTTAVTMSLSDALSGFGTTSLYLRNVGANIAFGKYENGTNNSSLYTLNQINPKVLIRWNNVTQLADIFVNGAKVISNTSFVATATIQHLWATGNQQPVYLQQMALFNEPLNDFKCEQLTTGNFKTYNSMAASYNYFVI